MTMFFDLTDVPVAAKSKVLLETVAHKVPDRQFDVQVSELARITGSPFAYWIGERVRAAFESLVPLESSSRSAKLGASTKNDFRYLRLSWEVNPKSLGHSPTSRWVFFIKGGAYAKFFGETSVVIPWRGQVREIEAELNQKFPYLKGNVDFVLHRKDPHFRPGLTWSSRTQKGLGMRVMPSGCIFSHKGPAIFVEGDDRNQLLALLSITASSPFLALIKLSMAFGSYEVGVLQRTPVPELGPDSITKLADLARRGWSAHRRSSNFAETSSTFLLPAALRIGRAQSGKEGEGALGIQGEIDRICWPLFGFGEHDVGPDSRLAGQAAEAEADELDDEEVPEEEAGAAIEPLGMISWSVGVAFGRFDIGLATGERPIPAEPDPFDPLPAKSPGMLPDGNAPFMPTSGVFVDDPGHEDDLAARVTAVYERVGETPPVPDALRKTLAKDFFPAHIRMYSKSRRKAPICWQLATPSASYSVWLYIHAFGKDTLFRVQNDYVAPKLTHERRELEGLLAEAGPSPTIAQNRDIEAQSNFVEELSALLDEVKRVAPLWDPDLDDGVILNFAPLWRLVPQNRAWQKELRAAWASLVAGDYDWARLSMRLWPERVVPKCAKDRSLAIAHDLEDVFWFEDAAGKWQARPTPTRPLDDLIADRTSPAVRAALQSLLNAPDPVAATGRSRRKKS